MKKTAHDARRRAIQLSAHEAGSAGQFISHGLDTCFQLIAVRIAAAPIIAQRLHARDSDGKFSQTLAPRAAEAVRNDHRNRDAGLLLQCALERSRRNGRRSSGSSSAVLASVNVRDIDAAIGAKKPMRRLRDEHTILAP